MTHAIAIGPALAPAFALALGLAACGRGDSGSAHGMPAAAEVKPLATASNTFGFELWARAGGTGNAAISPASISAALAMTWGGARGVTSDEMRAVLHLDRDPSKTMATWGALSAALQDPKRPLQLRIANRLFGQSGYGFEPAYLDQTRAAFAAPLEPVDFKAADAARAHINGWVEDRTEHRIKDLLPPRSVTEDTRLVLVNAIYFHADWLHPFDKRLTHDFPFHVTAAQDKPAPMMSQHGDLRWARADGVAVLELPYKGDDAAMIVVLPDQVDGLADVERTLDAARLARWIGALAEVEINVSLPKFTIDPKQSVALAGALAALGMPSAFSPDTADLSGIAKPSDPGRRLFISAVFHKAYVAVDETSTEAAAATAVVSSDGTGPEPEQPRVESFFADHPFLFLIVDRRSGMVLFMGRVADPTS